MREGAWGRDRERERERERERIPSRLHSVGIEPNVRLELTNREIMTFVETESLTLTRLSHPGTPFLYVFYLSLHLNLFGAVTFSFLCPTGYSVRQEIY